MSGRCADCRHFAPDWPERPPPGVPCAAEQMVIVPVDGRCSAWSPAPLTEALATCGRFRALTPGLLQRRHAHLRDIIAWARYRDPGDPLHGKFPMEGAA